MTKTPQSTSTARWTAVLTLAFVAAISYWGMTMAQPPAAAPASAPATDFSAERALQHLRVFARVPHPVGSAEHDKVRDYIVAQLRALGVQPELQTTTVVGPRWGSPYAAATVSNILARVPGTANTRAVMLAAHYDSVTAGPGASDDGHGVVVELETLRALRASPPLRNDIIFLFTDSEEGGMLGAKAFVDQHPWAKQVGLVLNFDNRGASGPGLMFETSEGNGKLVRNFAAAAPNPVTSSLSYEVYKLIPNDTDLTFFKQAGLPGMGFAYVGDVIYYHTQYDDVAHLNPGSLQQEGGYALALARQFGGIDVSNMRSPDATYFVLPFFGVAVYPASWSLPLAVAAALLLAAILALGIAKRRMSLGGILAAFLQFVLTAVVASVAVWVMWSLMKGRASNFWQAFAGDPYHAGVYREDSVALALAITTGLYALFFRRSSVLNLWGGALLLWLILAVATSVTLPGATYLFLWPMVACAIGLALMLLLDWQPEGAGGAALACLFAIPGLILLAPTIELLFISLTMRMAFGAAFVIVLTLGLLIPCLKLMAAPGRWWLPGVAALVCVVCLAAGASMAGFDHDSPRTNSIYYGLDTDAHKAVWFSPDQQEDDWTAHYLGANPQRVALPQFVPYLSWQYMTHEAPPVDLAAPVIEKLDDSNDGATRTLRLRVTSPRHAPRMYVYGDARYEVIAADVDGTLIDASKAFVGLKPGQKEYTFKMRRWGLNYFNVPPEGIVLHMRLKGAAPGYRMDAVDQSYGLAGLPGVSPRPDTMIPFPLMTDSIFVRKSYEF